MNLLLPVAGMSTRFPNMKPKWLLTNPNGNLMIIESILGLNLDKFNNIYIISIEEHLNQYEFMDGIKKQFAQIGHLEKLKFIILISFSAPVAPLPCKKRPSSTTKLMSPLRFFAEKNTGDPGQSTAALNQALSLSRLAA